MSYDECFVQPVPLKPDAITEYMVEDAISRGMFLICGPHAAGLKGFWARFASSRSDFAAGPWKAAGHSLILMEAIRMAYCIKFEGFTKVPRSEVFA